jgi:hypothetical protein
MKNSILICLVYLCIITSIQVVILVDIDRKTGVYNQGIENLIKKELDRQVHDAKNDLSYQISCQTGHLQFCEEVE